MSESSRFVTGRSPQEPTTGLSFTARSSKPALVAMSILTSELARAAGLTAGAYEAEAAASIILSTRTSEREHGNLRRCQQTCGHRGEDKPRARQDKLNTKG